MSPLWWRATTAWSAGVRSLISGMLNSHARPPELRSCLHPSNEYSWRVKGARPRRWARQRAALVCDEKLRSIVSTSPSRSVVSCTILEGTSEIQRPVVATSISGVHSL